MINRIVWSMARLMMILQSKMHMMQKAVSAAFTRRVKMNMFLVLIWSWIQLCIWSELNFVSAVESGAGETLKLVSMTGLIGWYITNFSIKRDLSLGHHYVLTGEDNPRKLAETIGR